MKEFNSKMDKKFSIVMALLLLAFQLVSIVSMPATVVAAVNKDVEVKIELVGNSTGIIQKGELFEVEATVTNKTGETINDISLNINRVDGLIPTGENWTIDVADKLENNESISKRITFHYNGTDSAITLSMHTVFNRDGKRETSEYTSKIYGIYSETPSDSIPPGSAKNKPDIKVKPGIRMPVVNAGEDVGISLPIVNTSSITAKNLIISIDTSDVNSLPFTFEQINLSKRLENLAPGKEETVTFNVKTKSYISDGIYPVKINYEYLNSANNSFTASEIIYIKVLNAQTPPKITLEKFSVYSNDGENPLPGSMFSLTLQLKNHGSASASDVKVSLKGLSNDGIFVTHSADTKYVTSIDGQTTQNVEYFLYVSDKFKGNNVSLTASVEYKDSSGKAYTDEYQFFVKITEIEEEEEETEETSPELILKDLEFPQDQIDAGDELGIRFSLENIGNDIAHNVKISITCEDGILPISSSTLVIDALEKGQTKDFSFDLYAKESAVTKNHLVTINVEYENKIDEVKKETDQKTEKLSFSRYAGIYVKAVEKEDEEETKTVPKIIISRYDFEPETVKAGENFLLKLSFLNTSKIVPIRNVKITFSAKDGIFIPTSSSNTFFIENMDVQGGAEREVELFAKSDAPAKSHPLTLNFEYEDEKGTQYTATEEISIPVTQELRLEIGQLQMPTDTMEGQPIPIFLDFFNMGKSTLYNLMVSLEGEGFRGENSDYFVGNFDSGRSDYYEVMLTPTATGEVTGNVLFSFEDESGKKNEIRKEFKLNVTPMQMPEFPVDGGYPGEGFPGGEMPGQEQGNKLFTPLNIGIGIGTLLLITIITIIIIKKKRSRKAEMMLDE